MFGLQLFGMGQVFFQRWQHFLRERFQLRSAFGLVIGHGVRLFLEQLDRWTTNGEDFTCPARMIFPLLSYHKHKHKQRDETK